MASNVNPGSSSETVEQGIPADSSHGKMRRGAAHLESGGCILAYHEILPSESKYAYHVSSKQFERQLSLFAETKGLGKSIPGITFDDGHRSSYELAIPMLEQAGLKATFFVLAGHVGNNPEFISWSQAREMVSAGHQVQSHGWSHKLLTMCSPQELDEELARSKEELEQRLGTGVTSISAPGGRWDARVISASAQAGYKFFFTSNPWMPLRTQEGLQIKGRLMVTGRMDSAALKAQMEMSGARRFISRSKYEAKEKVRTLLGDRMYHRIWCWLSNYTPDDGMEVQMGGEARRRTE